MSKVELKSSEGKPVPDVTFRTRTQDGQWKDVTTKEIFGGKTVAVFSLPGAFTPTCSTSHVPRYNSLLPVFKKNGVDEIVCISVNDAFVMNAWQQDQRAPDITFIPDGNGEFSEGLGMLVDKKGLGFGKRSWRYSMLVKNGTIDKMFIEPEKEGDPFEVSDADTMLKYINPDFKEPDNVFMISRKGCGHCARARKALADAGYTSFEEVELGEQISVKTLLATTGRTSTPQVWINGKHIGGADETVAFLGAQKK
eukprot:TRINITY_DN435_c0_g1_i2.p1 TRINITY_DN435_c0_g1~~TRINITY_DN435_c0_g1_i2.p1  ORF type:complete len:260 (-),score=70.72 TRINITY_DN435_c0_g1_i2:46-804(-)